MSATIYWFSGTGNSLYAAKCLADGLGGALLYPMSSGVPTGAAGGEKTGFVFPSYYGNLPRIVRSFVEKLEVKPESYIFAVVTMGALGQGSIAALESVLMKKNLHLDYGVGIIMPANYVIKYNPANKAKVEGRLDRVAKKIGAISSQIAAGVQSVKKLKITTGNLYKNIEALDADFFVEDSCTACGQCAKLCPVGNIRIDGGKPVWLRHCEHCVACINWCPAQAIQHGTETKTRRRYQNPRITVNEMRSG
jgi:Pyruvate/2-oxoacid:ferredoxin oxidoreductase delta subunit